MIINVVTLISFLCFGASSASNAAFFATSGSKSHKNIFQSLIEEMAHRGHTVTVFSLHPLEKAITGVREVVVSSGVPMYKKVGQTYLPGSGGPTISEFFGILGSAAQQFCLEVVKTQEVQNMLNGKEKYDIIFANHFFDDCGVAIAHIINVPLVFVHSNALFGHFANNLRIPFPIVHVPYNFMTSYSDKMGFWERLTNLATTATCTYYKEFVYAPQMDATLRSIFGDNLPSSLEMERNMSLLLLNTHVSINIPTPYLPHTVEVGGLQLREGKPLTKDVQEWMDGAGPDGVIYFSLGTVLPASQMDAKFRNLFLQAFSKLPQRVVWKWETGEMEGLPDNVRVFKYLPQQDVLAHHATKLFITHVGLLSLQETIYHGVPIVGIPVGIDQFYNMQNALKRKLGLELAWDTITSEKLLDAIQTVIGNPSYRENVKKVADIFKDQPMSPMDTAMFWIEFVIKHNGAPHFRSAVLDLKWYEYYMVDIAALLISAATIVFLCIYFILRCLCRGLYRKTLPSKEKKKRS